MSDIPSRIDQARAVAAEFAQRYPRHTWEAMDIAVGVGGHDGSVCVVFSSEATCFSDPFSLDDARFHCDPTEFYGFSASDTECLAAFNFPAGVVQNGLPGPTNDPSIVQPHPSIPGPGGPSYGGDHPRAIP